MAQLEQLLTEKGVKSLEKARKSNSKSDWKVAETLFDNLVRKCTKQGCFIELKTTEKVIRNKKGRIIKVISKTKVKRIRLKSIGLHSHNVSWSVGALWVKPIIQNNRIVFFWKGCYIDGATIFGESINKYQD